MKKFILLFIILLFTAEFDAQVSIGSHLPAASGALLDLKEFPSAMPDGANSTRGLMLPRVNLEKRTELQPLFPSSAIGTPDYENVQKVQHTGVVVFNVNKVASELLAFGLYVWDGTQWTPMGHDDSTSDYSFDLSKTKVYGLYKRQSAVMAEHYIEVTIIADAQIIGSFYDIKTTSSVNGLTFSGRGEIISTSQTVRLQAAGTPLDAGTHTFTLEANNRTNTRFAVDVNTVYPKMKVAGFGSSAYNIAGGMSSGMYKLVNSPSAFGMQETSLVKTEGFDFINNFALNDATLSAAIAAKPDIIITGYPTSLSANQSNILKQYADQGGVVITFIEESAGARNIANSMFGTTTITSSSGGTRGTIYNFAGASDDPIVNGPFANLNISKWGEDASTTIYINDLPSDEAVIYSTHTNGTGATIFRHKTLNYLYVGDGGFCSYYANGGGATDYGAYPFRLTQQSTNDFLPEPKQYGEPASAKTTVYNSAIFANIFAWAIDRAYSNGINSSQWKP